ncbi:hypothetical protein BT96DRAFT_616084 [Gymnopus androsaceus JB14]|uniref:Zn(2)-C6 fungal-type domain-containing protein n=1 Tax=Gymnopus androsaceus JB14 TaxID=1447944 RepID=A0A6A4HSD2_9AGAR|nr:hypothetical protein BT96DRAFT_616084 [Gymnopus androsaceus JB14]
MASTQIPLTGFRKRRLQGACDMCRSRKIRCDSAKMPGNNCSNCASFGSECTHLMSASKKVALTYSKCTFLLTSTRLVDEEKKRRSRYPSGLSTYGLARLRFRLCQNSHIRHFILLDDLPASN